MPDHPRICDYGDSTYRQDFWEGQGREYEDMVERRVLAQLLPDRGLRMLEVGAGFGRVSGEYSMYEQVVLLDYSLEQLQFARQKLGDSRFVYVAADAYAMPFGVGVFDGATMIRVIHHFEDVTAVLMQIRRSLCQGASFILEYANKRNLKSMLRHLLGRNQWDPYSLEPVEFVELNFNFHPEFMRSQLANLGFGINREVPVSWLRLPLLKRFAPNSLLLTFDNLMQHTGWCLSPSVFLDLQVGNRRDADAPPTADSPLDILICPQSATNLRREGDVLISGTGLRWGIFDGVYDFRQPLD